MSIQIQEMTKYDIINAPLPNHNSSYTVIPHREVIDNTINLLRASGFTIINERYRANMGCQEAQGIYYITPKRDDVCEEIQNEEELGMMFAWTNSYNKRVRFQCAIGGYVLVCGNGMCTGDMMSFSRKHSGTANHDAKMQISNQIKHAEKFFKRIITDRDNMKIIPLLKQQQAELIGRLYCNELLGSQQISIVKQEMNNPTYAYGTDAENCWTFYNHVTHALKKSHPRTWLSDLQKFHEFMVADVLGTMGLNQIDTTNPTQEHLANEEFHDIKADEALESEVEPVWETLEEEKEDEEEDDFIINDEPGETIEAKTVAVADFLEEEAEKKETGIERMEKGLAIDADAERIGFRKDLVKDDKPVEVYKPDSFHLKVLSGEILAEDDDKPEITGIPDGNSLSDTE